MVVNGMACFQNSVVTDNEASCIHLETLTLKPSALQPLIDVTVSRDLGVLLVGALNVRALPFGVYIQVLTFGISHVSALVMAGSGSRDFLESDRATTSAMFPTGSGKPVPYNVGMLPT